MPIHDLDIDPQHLVDWLRRHPGDYLASVTREIAPGAEAPPAEAGRDAPPAAVTATLEVGPADAGARWRIAAVARDVSGAHVPEDGSAPDGPVEIGLDAFEAEFLAGDTAEVFVSAEYDDANGKRRFERAYARMLGV